MYAKSALLRLLDGYDYPYIISVKETKGTLFSEFRDDVKRGVAIKEVDTTDFGVDIKKKSSEISIQSKSQIRPR